VAHTKKLRHENLAYHVANKKMEELRATAFDSLPASGSISDAMLLQIPSGSGSFTTADHAGFTGLKEITVEEFCQTYEAPYTKFYKDLGITATRKEMKKWYLGEVLKYPDPALMENATEVLTELAEEGLTLGIVSTHSYRHLMMQLEKNGLFSFFRSIAGDQEIKHEAISSFCRLFRFKPREVLFVGDLPSDIRDGNIAGVVTIFFRGKFNVPIKYPADYCIENLTEIGAILRRNTI
jgi:phosphoglycolate phosphatase-like HAD superfamily hydrolase